MSGLVRINLDWDSGNGGAMNREITHSTTGNNVTGSAHVAHDNKFDSSIGPTEDEVWHYHSKSISNDRETHA